MFPLYILSYVVQRASWSATNYYSSQWLEEAKACDQLNRAFTPVKKDLSDPGFNAECFHSSNDSKVHHSMDG